MTRIDFLPLPPPARNVVRVKKVKKTYEGDEQTILRRTRTHKQYQSVDIIV